MVESQHELIGKAVAGDRIALQELLFLHFTQLQHQISPKLPGALRHVLSVEDVLQETFLQAYRDIEQFDVASGVSFLSWLRAIADHRLADTVKGLNRQKRGGGRRRAVPAVGPRSSSIADLLETLPDTACTPSRLAAHREAATAVQVAIGALPDGQREAVRLRFLDGKSLPETAAAMGRTPSAVRSLIHRAKLQLSQALGHASQWLDSR
jgi:RNA polymerase sigma-70 factor (ECF subfamily)